jgi:hypothetical protein
VPLPVELREVGDAYELRIGHGRVVEYASPGKLVDKLLELGVDKGWRCESPPLSPDSLTLRSGRAAAATRGV